MIDLIHPYYPVDRGEGLPSLVAAKGVGNSMSEFEERGHVVLIFIRSSLL